MRERELVFIPAPGMGHLAPTVELANHIIKRDHRISALILIISFPFDYTQVNSYINSLPFNSNLTFITLPPLPNPIDPSICNFLPTLILLHKPLVMQAMQNRVNHSNQAPKPLGFILDMFCTTMIDVAQHFNLPSYIYFTPGATFLNLLFYFQSLYHDHGVDVPTRFNDPHMELDLPGFQTRVPSKVLPIAFLDKGGEWEVMLEMGSKFRQCDGILINSFMELELDAIQALVDLTKDKLIPSVYPVGPILVLDKKSSSESKKKEESIMRWLDEQPESSVVFVCFGSMGCFNEVQVKEIANGLDRAGHRFLWSLRKPPPEGSFGIPTEYERLEEVVPEGFMDRTTHRGKVIGWAPQVLILAHRAVGGFVSHCGWNSTLESQWFGMPMGTWPMNAEQQLNAFKLVKELKVGVEIRMDYRQGWKSRKGNFVVTREEIEKGIKDLMSMNEEMREKVKKMSENSRKTLEHGGLSHYWLGRFIQDVFALNNIELN